MMTLMRICLLYLLLSITNLNINLVLSLTPSRIAHRRRAQLAPIVPIAASNGFGNIPKPDIITPLAGTNNTNIERFLMMYTCKKCNGRNAQLISKIAYKEGIVVSTCKTCKVTHLIADNLKKLDMSEYGTKIDEYLESKGERVQRMSVSREDLENNYIIEKDGVVSLQPKIGGQVLN